MPTIPPPKAARWWRSSATGDRIVCDLCPRECSLKPGDRGFCFVRQNTDGQMALTTYGKSTGFCIDPIEKKPLNHFLPGTPVLSFGTAGCNLGCQFCQNWDISKSREVERLSENASPEMIAQAAVQTNCRSVAFTYNDPVIWAEYAIDTAHACRTVGIKSVAVTAGYISPAAREEFFHAMDAANVDLKAFTEDFYHSITYSHLQPVLETLHWLKHESDVWFEITNLIIPDANDHPDEIRRMADWILQSVGDQVPVHFSAFHPDFRMTDRHRTPHSTLLKAKEIAQNAGLKFVYVGNVNDPQNQSTWCPGCKTLLIERNWYQLGAYRLQGNQCSQCGLRIPGYFEDKPGSWGQKRQPVRISSFQQPSDKINHMHSGNTSNVSVLARLTGSQETAIKKATCELLAAAVQNKAVCLTDQTLSGAADLSVMGVFVTLKRNGQLRGCIGSLGQPMSLRSALTESASKTAVADPRFPPVELAELQHLTVDVTLLYNFETVTETGLARISAVEVGRHGLRIQIGRQAGLLLPSVPVEQGWDAQTFLDQVCRKAGLPVTAWQQPDAHLQRFEGRILSSPFDQTVLKFDDKHTKDSFSEKQMKDLAEYTRRNVGAVLQRAVPDCRLPAGCSDGTVDGIALQLAFPGSDVNRVFTKLQLRGGLPLQSTLMQLTEAAAGWLQQVQFRLTEVPALEVDLALFTDPVMHGTVAAAAMQDFNPASRALIVSEQQRTAWRFDPRRKPSDLLQMTSEAAAIIHPAESAVASMAIYSSRSQPMSASSVVRPVPNNSFRPPAVAGTFYPADAQQLEQIVDRCFAAVGRDSTAQVRQWPAIMVPHAGLRFSGHIAAGVLCKTRIPETVIIIGPRHTPHGANLAVAPNDFWQLPTGKMSTDRQLAQRLVDKIDGLCFDADAHAREHSIEIELPLLQRLAPTVKVVGITIGQLTLPECLQAGRQLAAAISPLVAPPLLIISSDMHHFGSDEENRRLDALALSAIDSLDPAILFETVVSNQISMCGVLPAVIVMEALRQTNQLQVAQRSGYDTSASVTGDKSRVVGYAGVMFGPHDI